MYGDFNPEIGQLLRAERTALHQTVLDLRPEVCLEVGTWKGAGSTLQIAAALSINNKGHLHTCEPDPLLHATASAYYGPDGPGADFATFLTLHKKTSGELIQQLANSGRRIDFAFFDGPEDADVALQDFLALQPLTKPGAVLAVHDWLHQPESVKAVKLKKYMLDHTGWILHNLLGPPDSVGLVFFRKL
jgi:predicted O-methyltransferase YrrM